jgi:tetratricopeptide (TPR) repeat protein
MDRLDRLSIWTIIILIISTGALIAGHADAVRPDRQNKHNATVVDKAGVTGEIDDRVKMIRNLMETDGINRAEALIKELLQKYPYEGESHMLMGDTFMRRQEPVQAMREYKEAIELNPDYLDKKSPIFQGKKLKTAVGEAMAEIEKKLTLNPADESMKADRKIIYYLQRKIAGSCG